MAVRAKKKPSRKRNPGRRSQPLKDDQLAARRTRVAAMRQAGKKQREIAAAEGVSQKTISLDLRHIREEMLDRRSNALYRVLMSELDEQLKLRAEFMRGWQRSTEVRERTHTKRMIGKDGKELGTEVAVTREGQAGDPRFLQGAALIGERILKILGVDADTFARSDHDAPDEIGSTLPAEGEEGEGRGRIITISVVPPENEA